MIRRLGLSLLILLLAALLVAAGWLFGTSPGARVVITYISGVLPNVKLRHQDGPLVGPLTLRKVDIKMGATRLQIDHLALDWSASCLLMGDLCLHDVHARHLLLTLPPPPASPPPATGRRKLPTLRLPLGIDADNLVIDRFDIVRGQLNMHFTDVATELTWDDDGMRIARLSVSMPSWTARATGTLRPAGDWPLDANLYFRVPRAGNGEPTFTLEGRGSGTLLDTRLDLASAGTVESTLKGVLQTLEPGLPFTAEARADRIRIPPGAADDKATWMRDVMLAAEGRIIHGFTITGDALIDTPWAPPLPAHANVTAGWRGVNGGELRITDPRLAATLTTDWQWLGGQHFRFDGRIRHLDLALFNPALASSLAGQLAIRGELVNGDNDVRIDVKGLAGTLGPRPVSARGPLRWHESRWRFSSFLLFQGANRAQLNGTLADSWDVNTTLLLDDLNTLLPAFAGRAVGSAHISGAPTDPRFAFRLEGTDVLLPTVTLPAPVDRQVRLPAASWTINGNASLHHADIVEARTLEGQAFMLAGTGSVDWRDALRWDIDTLLSDFPLRHLARELGGRVSGPFASTGVLGERLEELTLRTDLAGRLDEQPLHIAGGLRFTPGTLDVQSLEMRHGDNKASASGALDAGRVRLVLDASAPELANSFRGLSGTLFANANFAGGRETVAGTASVDARQLRYGALAAASIDGQLALAAGGHAASRLELSAKGIRAGQGALDAALALDGTRRDHHLTLGLEQAALSLAIDVDGHWVDDAWGGELASGSLQWLQWRWDAVGNPALAVRQQQLHVAPHCWIDGKARACITAPAILGRSGELQGEAFHLPPGMLIADVLPLDTGISGTIGGTFAARWLDGVLEALTADVRNASPLVFAETADDGSQQPIATVDNLLAQADADGRHTHVNALIAGATLGTLDARAEVTQRNGHLDGNIRVDRFNIGLANAFANQVHEIGGTINADLALTGTLSLPRVTGNAALRDGRASLVRAPLSIEQVTLDGVFDGRSMQLGGHFRTPESRQDVAVNGNFSLRGHNWHGEATASGQDMVIALPPQYQFTTVPDLRLRLDGQRLLLSGSVRVPSGRIEMTSLPTQSVARSRDVILVREEEVVESRRSTMERNVDVGITLGDDILFKAFGAQGNLTGNLRVRSRPDIPLLVDGELHVTDGKYSAFGQTLTLRQADVIFNGPPDEPLVDATAFRTIDDPGVKEVGLRLTGSLRKPETTLWSTPELAQEEALSWLITGKPMAAGSGDTLGGEAAQAALSLGVAQGSVLLNQAGQQLGLNEFQLSAGGDGEDTELQVGTSLNERIYVGYNRRVFSGEESLLLRLHMTKKLMLEAVSGVESALDLFYTFEF